MKKLAVLLLLICAGVAPGFAQGILPNLAYNGQITSSCSTPNAACTNQVFVTNLGISGSPQTAGAGSTLDIPVWNYAAATITISGTYSGVTINFDFSDPSGGTNYFQSICARTDANILESSEAVPNNAVRAWQCPVWAATRFRVRASAYSSGSANINIVVTQAAIDPSLIVSASPPVIPGTTDPCQDLSQQKSSVPISLASATTTQLVALAAGQKVYVCGFTVTIAGSATSAATLTLVYGTGASCGTGTTSLTGAYGSGIVLASSGTSGITIDTGYAATVTSTALANALCVTSAGTAVSISGILSFVQQ